MMSLNDAAVSLSGFRRLKISLLYFIQHSAEQYSAFVEQHMDERRQRIEQLDSFVRHRLRLYRKAQEHMQRQTANKTVRYQTSISFHMKFLFPPLNRSKQ